MTLRYRPMRKEDVSPCVQILATHPILAPRFGETLKDVEHALHTTFSLDSVKAIALEETSRTGQSRLLGAGIIGFVTDEFATRVKTPPFFWIGPEVTHLTVLGATPFLRNSMLREANTLQGLNNITWLYLVNLPDIQRFDVQKLAMDAYNSALRGFRLKQILGQVAIAEELDAALRSGGLLLREDGSLIERPLEPLEYIVAKPHIFLMTKELVQMYLGSWTSLMFTYHDPLLGFSRAEQRLLEATLYGLTDEELIAELQISLSAVKKTWRSIYSRVERSGIPILPASPASHEEGDRGKGKRPRLLNYLREHPEELRPIAMKLLRQYRASNNDGNPATSPSRRRRVGRPHSNRVTD